jgi:hypothetical protein
VGSGSRGPLAAFLVVQCWSVPISARSDCAQAQRHAAQSARGGRSATCEHRRCVQAERSPLPRWRSGVLLTVVAAWALLSAAVLVSVLCARALRCCCWGLPDRADRDLLGGPVSLCRTHETPAAFEEVACSSGVPAEGVKTYRLMSVTGPMHHLRRSPADSSAVCARRRCDHLSVV